jgi:hypothetical protein
MSDDIILSVIYDKENLNFFMVLIVDGYQLLKFILFQIVILHY